MLFRPAKAGLRLENVRMDDIDDLLKRNPRAAADYRGVQDALAILAVLREAGIAKGDQNTLLDRDAIIGLRPSRRMRMRLRSTLSSAAQPLAPPLLSSGSGD